ncbi:hypothetical protein GOODEAATRI_034582, partial [Goodea atripinnis]
RAPNGTLILKASREAQGVGPQKGAYRAKPMEEVEADAPPHVVQEGGDDALLRYSSAYPDFLEAVRFHRAFEEAHARSQQPGQEGQALVGFGDFKYETLLSLYECVDPKKIQ